MAQTKYFDYLSEIRSKKAVEPYGLTVGIGALFGYNVISYDGSNLLVYSDTEKNYRHNLTNERMVLTNPASACITPDGIISVETSEVLIPLILGAFSGNKEVAIFASHTYSKEEGGTPTTYRAYVNPDPNNNWYNKLKANTATMETWLELFNANLKRNSEVVVAMVTIKRVGNDHEVSKILNPYKYVWGVSEYVTLEQHESDIENLRQLIPTFELLKVGLTNKEISVKTRVNKNDTETPVTGDIISILDPGFTISRLGDAMELLMRLVFNFAGGIDLSKQIVVDFAAEMDYTIPVSIEPPFQTPIAFGWLTSSTENPETGKRVVQNTHAVYGSLNLTTNKFHLIMELFPIKGNQATVAANLLPKGDLTIRIPTMVQLSEMFNIQLGVTSQQGTTGTGDVSGAGRYRRGTIVNVNASPAIGSGFVGWYEGNTLLATDQAYRFEVTRSVNLTAMFNGSSTKVKVDVTVDPVGKATITGAGQYAVNTQCTLGCVPATGYGFEYWEMEGIKYTINPLTFGVSRSTTVKCKLTAPKRNVSLFSSPSGVFTLNGAGSYEVGTNVTIRATLANAGFRFVGWYKNSVSSSNLLSTNQNYSFTMQDADISILAYGEEKPVEPTYYTLYTNTQGSGIVQGGGQYSAGANATISAYPSSGYEFDYWSGDASGTNRITSVSMSGDKSVTAHFRYVGGGGPTTYTLSTYTNPAGSGSVSGGGSYVEGAQATITASPASGRTFTGWTGDKTGSSNPTTIVMNGNKSVTANFSGAAPSDQCKLTVNVVGGTYGYTNLDGVTTYPEGSVVSLSAYPNASGNIGVFDGWSGDASGTAKNIQVTMNRDKTITATFHKAETPPAGDELTTNAVPANGGTVTVTDGPSGYWTIKATPTAGWSFANWSGAIGGKVNPTTVLKEGKKKTVSATFVENPAGEEVLLSISGEPASPNNQARYKIEGYSEGLGSTSARVGKNATVTISVTQIPSGYKINGWTDQDGGRVNSGSPQFTYSPTKDTQLTAHWVLDN